MKLATLLNNTPDGILHVVSRNLTKAAPATGIAATMQYAMDNWEQAEPALRALAETLESGVLNEEIPFNPSEAAAPLPRAYQWADASAYVNHVLLVRKARGAEMLETFYEEPVVYQGAGDVNLGSQDDIPLSDEMFGCDFEAEVAVILGPVQQGAEAETAKKAIRLIMLANDVSLRGLVPGDLAKGFGFFHSKPQTAFTPVAVTPDELGAAWDGDRLHLPMNVTWNGKPFGRAEAGEGMVFGFGDLAAHIVRTRPCGAGTILGSGTVSNEDETRGASCIAEIRAREAIRTGKASTDFMRFGDTVKIEMLDASGNSVFGAIEQRVIRLDGATSDD